MATPMYSSKLSGSKFKNWIKAGLGVLYTKEGIEPFVCDEIEQFQKKCLSDICNNNGLPAGTTCSSCCTENVVVCPTNRICNVNRGKCKFHRNSATQYLPSGCPNKICHNFENDIKNAHRYNGPSYKNTDASQWCSNAWEVAKCFMPPDGYKDVACASETDFNGIISVIINYKAFQSKIKDNLSKKSSSIFEQGREVGKAVRHCPQLEMEDTDLKHYFTDLQNLLSDPAYLSANTAALNAKTKLLQLQKDTLVIGKDDIQNVLEDVAKAVQDKIRTEIDEHKKEAEKKKLELINTTNESVKAIAKQGKVSIAQLDNALKSAIDEIEKQTKESLTKVHSEADIAMKQIHACADKGANMLEDKAEVGIKQIEESTDKGVSKLEVKAEVGVKQIEDSTDKGVNKLEVKAEVGVKQIEDSTNKGVSKLEVKAEVGVKQIENSTDKGANMLEDKAEVGVKQIEDSTDKGASKLEVKAEAGLKQIEDSTDKGVNKLEVKAEAEVSKISAKADEKLKQIEESTTGNKEDKYNRLKEDLREDLIDLYREEYHTLPLSPLLEENDTPLLEFYVIPDIESVEIQRARGGGKEARSKVTSLHDVFYKEKEPCRKIYLTADAGFGKTALSKRLVLTWCQAKNCIPNEDEHFKKEDISTMSNFDFVFLLSLRDCSEEGDIDEMIKKQIINDLAHTISTSDFENILSKERCLIILDGLDEFTHAKSDIPHRRARRTCTILTTTRPWKLGVSKIRASEIERKLELVGLSKSSARRLKRSVISLLWGETDIKKHIQEFDRAVSERGISDLETIPLLLVYLLCLWCDETDLGKSRTELYCQIANLLLKRTFEKYPDMKQPCEQPKSDIPQCISRNGHCRKHYNLLNALGRLAFETLFDETKDQNLVFDMAVAEKCLSDKDLLQLSRHSGIITHNKDQTKINKQMQKTSFSHATVQEFFAALYISVSWDQEEVRTKVLSFCHCIARILAMSKVFVFTSGINATVFSSMSKDLMKVISEDKITSEYRSTTDEDCEPLKDIQDMYISCMKENTSDKELKLFCQDFFFSEDCEEEKYFTYLVRLAVQNKNNMASINIDTADSGRSLREIIDCCELHELFQINKIVYWSEVENAQLPVLLDKSPKCVAVMSSDPLGDSWSREMLETLQNNSLLQAVCIYGFQMSHDVLNDFLNYIINRKTMTEIGLWYLDCTEHKCSSSEDEDSYTEHWSRSCTFSLDFSQHSDLRKLELWEIPKVSQLKVNSQVKHVQLLGDINLGEMSLPPEMANIESVDLRFVNMSASTLRDLVKVVEKLSHKVTVTIGWSCEIEPETEFEHVKQDIHSSQNFRVTKDDWQFVFETKVES